MFDFMGRRKAGRPAEGDRRRGRGPITIGFEQLEGREMLSTGLCLTIAPSSPPPLPSMPRPIVGRLDPAATGEPAFRPRPRPGPEWRWTRPWRPAGRSRLDWQ